MREPFVVKDFVVPVVAAIGKSYTARPLTAAEAVEDWLVLQANPDAIVRQRGGSKVRDEWPYACTLEANFKDLAWLELCAEYKQLFSYVLRRKDGVYAGAVYIYPIEIFFPKLAKQYDVDFSFWLTQAECDRGEYEPTFHSLLDWLQKDWPFAAERIYLRNAEMPESVRARQK